MIDSNFPIVILLTEPYQAFRRTGELLEAEDIQVIQSPDSLPVGVDFKILKCQATDYDVKLIRWTLMNLGILERSPT